MNRTYLCAALSLVLAAGSARADFSYEQTTKITGGMMAGMMKFAGAFSKQAREPMTSSISVKGNRMAMTSARNINIIDLDAETMTDIDLEKKTYSVITFADFGRAMQRLGQKMGQKNDSAEMNFKADVKNTGATRTINGFQTKETILTLTIEGQDKKTGDKGGMNVVTDMWLAPNLPGYEEVKNFYAKMAQKLAFAPGMSGFGAMMGGQQAGLAKGMSEMYKEASKIDGVPVLQVVRLGGTMEGMSEADMARMQQAQAEAEQQGPPPTAGEVAGAAAGSAATNAAAGRMGRFGGLAGGLGAGSGLGGFGRKKKQQEEQQPAQQQAQTPPPAAPSAQPAGGMGATPPGTLMELTTELTAFSSGAVDSAKLSVPAGFKQVDHPMAKELK
jgi:hypothetical protein